MSSRKRVTQAAGILRSNNLSSSRFDHYLNFSLLLLYISKWDQKLHLELTSHIWCENQYSQNSGNNTEFNVKCYFKSMFFDKQYKAEKLS